ncbi:hypothetical protein IAR55_003031 [Kwoniella newhampshirensis]|uniref:Zn(2)-C6 fungal-type domain-containing protein n=1 Tax=Kwoniella newhampshirensis TaxID=1651941 RepID=A0AAW0Z0G6_9TREE
MSVSPTRVAKAARPRVWRACEVCRKRKIRCDGQDPCKFCVTNNRECSFERVQDHASLSRQRDNDTQDRLQRLEDRLDSLIPLIETTHTWVLHLGGGSVDPAMVNSVIADPIHDSGPSSEDASTSFIASSRIPSDSTFTGVDRADRNMIAGPSHEGLSGKSTEVAADSDDQLLNGHSAAQDPVAELLRPDSWADRLAGQFARDSTGNMRYLGGTPTFVLTEAVDSVRQAKLNFTTDHSSSTKQDRPTVDHLYFRPNVLYRPLNGLPAPETVVYPPMALSDALVHMYFSKIHHTFPIVDKPRFLQQYQTAMDGLRQGRPSKDSHFLCVLFAVYASAASLTKKVFHDRTEFEFSSPKEYIGLEFYEKALYMYWIGFRTMKLENIVCMALLSACLAGWNTLSQSWVLAGQAVRGAQDLGLHRSPKKAEVDPIAKEYRRRVWWCVYGLDKILSVSLGRPSGVNDDDCDVELPSDQYCCEGSDLRREAPGNNPMTGFKSLLEIYAIAGRIERDAHNISFLKKYDNCADSPEVQETINKLDSMLDEWSDTLPDSVRYAANDPQRTDMFALCLLGHFALYACTLNLHRPFMPDLNTSSPTYTSRALKKCVDAARGCIRVGEEVKKLLPTSHHCQFCVQYLTISGVTLLRCLPFVRNVQELITDAIRCRHLLAKLEDTWPGSKRCGALVQDLLDICKNTWPGSSGHHRAGNPPTQATVEGVLTPPAPARGRKRTHDQALSSGSNIQGEAARKDVNADLELPHHDGLAVDVPLQLDGLDAITVAPLSEEQTGHEMTLPPSQTFDPDSSTNQEVSWDYPADPLDYTYLTSEAPFDLADEIGALLDTFQTSSALTTDLEPWPE